MKYNDREKDKVIYIYIYIEVESPYTNSKNKQRNFYCLPRVVKTAAAEHKLRAPRSTREQQRFVANASHLSVALPRTLRREQTKNQTRNNTHIHNDDRQMAAPVTCFAILACFRRHQTIIIFVTSHPAICTTIPTRFICII